MMRRMLSGLRSLARGLSPGTDLGAEMEEEFRTHVELRAEHHMRAGMSARAALRTARLEFGSMERYREEGRASRGMGWLDELRSDVRYTVRSLRKAPGFTAVAVLTLALGVSVNASVFSLVSSTVLRPLPYAEPSDLVGLYQVREGAAYRTPWSYGEFAGLRERLGSYAGVAAYYADDVNLAGVGEDPVRVRAEMVSASYLPVLGIEPAVGRGFMPRDDVVGADPVVLIAHEVWSRLLGAEREPDARRLVINGVAATVIGVMPPGFRGLSGSGDVWFTHGAAARVYMTDFLVSEERFLHIVGRLRGGTSLRAAAAELASVGARSGITDAAPAAADDRELRPALLPLEELHRDPARLRAQLALSASALFVLLIAMLNLSGLLMARSVVRARESAVRAALGAGRARLLRHGLVEGGVIGLLGGAAGLLIGTWSVRLLARRAASDATAAGPAVDVDWRVLLFALTISVAAGMLAALGATLRATRGELTAGLKTNERGSSLRVGSLRRPTVLTVAAVGQIACSLLLLVGAALLIDGFRQLRSIEPGFNDTGVVAFTVTPPSTRYGDAAAPELLTRILERVRGVPGVEHATVSLCTPLSACSSTQLFIEGQPMSAAVIVGRHYVAADHFRTLGIPLLRGRALTEQDRAGRPRVAVINQTAARRLWPGEDPIGRRVWFGSGGGFASPDSLTEIVGIAGDVLYGAPGADIRPDFYTSYLQFAWPTTTVMVRTPMEAASLAGPLRRAVAEVDPNLPIHDVRTLEEWSRTVLADQRFATQALSAIASLGLLLACLGLYGIMAWSVAQRRREIGIRVALGSTAAQVVRLILSQGSALVVLGTTLGVAASLALAQTLRALVPHAAPFDPLLVAAVAALLLLVATVACWLPARAASRVDPIQTISEGS